MVAGTGNGTNGSGSGLTDPAAIFVEGTRVDAAVRDAIRQVRILHKKMGVPLVGSIDGKIITIAPEEISIDPESQRRT